MILFRINKENFREKNSLLLNIVFLIYASTFLIDSGLHRICIYLAALLWLIEGDFKNKFKQVLEQKIILLYVLIICCFVISLFLFSDVIDNGFWQNKYSNGFQYLINKPIQYFLMAIFISTSLKKEFLKWILFAFLLQSIYIMFYILFVYFGLLDGRVGSMILNMHRNNYAIGLLFGLSILFYFINIYKNKIFKSLSVILIFLFYFAIMISTSRISIVILCFITFYMFFFYFRKINVVKLILIFLISFIFLILLSINLNSRISSGMDNINKTFSESNYKTSIGIRIGLNIVSIELLTKNVNNFIFGLGMGNAKEVFKEHINETDINKKNILSHPHVHNQYFQTWIDGGVIAFVLYLILLYLLFKIKVRENEQNLKMLILIIFVLLSFSTIFYNNVRYLALISYYLGIILTFNKFQNLKLLEKNLILGNE